MSIIYFDCFSGISGDMTLGALIDAGVAVDELRSWLGTMPLDGYELQATRQHKGALAGTKLEVVVTDTPAEHRDLSTILNMISVSALPPRAQARAMSIFSRLAEAEAVVHGVKPEDVHFHEVGGIDSI